MASLNLWNSFEFTSQGVQRTGKQGLAASAFPEPYAVTVNGTGHFLTGSLATATVVTVYDDDDDVPIDWVYLHIWADTAYYVQLIGATSNVIVKLAAKQPFVLPGFDSLLAAVNTTKITGIAEPTLEDIDSIVLGNYSGGTMNYTVAVIN